MDDSPDPTPPTAPTPVPPSYGCGILLILIALGLCWLGVTFVSDVIWK